MASPAAVSMTLLVMSLGATCRYIVAAESGAVRMRRPLQNSTAPPRASRSVPVVRARTRGRASSYYRPRPAAAPGTCSIPDSSKHDRDRCAVVDNLRYETPHQFQLWRFRTGVL